MKVLNCIFQTSVIVYRIILPHVDLITLSPGVHLGNGNLNMLHSRLPFQFVDCNSFYSTLTSIMKINLDYSIRLVPSNHISPYLPNLNWVSQAFIEFWGSCTRNLFWPKFKGSYCSLQSSSYATVELSRSIYSEGNFRNKSNSKLPQKIAFTSTLVQISLRIWNLHIFEFVLYFIIRHQNQKFGGNGRPL